MKSLLTLLSVVLVFSCGGVTVPTGAPSVEGTVLLWVSIPKPPEATPTVNIRINRVDPACTDITVTAVIADDRFVKRLPDGSLAAAQFDDLREGQVVRAWTSSEIGCPFTGEALVVEIVE